MYFGIPEGEAEAIALVHLLLHEGDVLRLGAERSEYRNAMERASLPGELVARPA